MINSIKTTEKPRRSVLLALAWYDYRAHMGASRYALEHGWHLDATMAQSNEFAHGWQGDGILCKLGCTKLHPEYLQFVQNLGLPAVDLSVFGQDIGLPSIEFDPVDIANKAQAHLYERGLHHFAFFPDDSNPPIALRKNAFVKALARHNHRVHLVPNIQHQPNERAWQQTAQDLGEHLAKLPKPLGVLCFSDEWGLKILEACQRVGLRVPDDVAVLGINNNTLVCESLSIPLSSVMLDMEAWAYEACRMLDQIMDGQPASPGMTAFPASSVVNRRSTDVVATDHPEVAKAVAFIANHYHQPIGVDDVVQATRMTRPGLKRAFSRHLRRSIRDEIQRVRLRHIKRLLIDTDYTLDTIAQEVGLAGARQLHQTFNRVEPLTPRQYRLQHRGSETISRF